MERSTAKIHWMKEALDEWTTAMARGDETNKLIEKYCKEDRKRAEVLFYLAFHFVTVTRGKTNGILLGPGIQTQDRPAKYQQTTSRSRKLIRRAKIFGKRFGSTVETVSSGS